jgi:ABC-type taurine transport system substrate-binding protein
MNMEPMSTLWFELWMMRIDFMKRYPESIKEYFCQETAQAQMKYLCATAIELTDAKKP